MVTIKVSFDLDGVRRLKLESDENGMPAVHNVRVDRGEERPSRATGQGGARRACSVLHYNRGCAPFYLQSSLAV